MTDAIEDLTLALWSINLGRKLDRLEAWVAHVDERMRALKGQGVDLLLMPEYACEQWLSFKPDGLRPEQEIAWMATQAELVLPLLAPLAARHDMALLAGTMPHARHNAFTNDGAVTSDSAYTNRAWLFLPDGRRIGQDKLSLTPFEQDPETWLLAPGDQLHVVEWRGVRLAICVCLDIEMPALSSLLAPEQPDLVLVPSMTASLSGYSRVFGCARARAVELMSAIAACGVIGVAPGTTQNDSNVSGCSVFLPCEPSLGETGLFAELPPIGGHDADGLMLIARDVPLRAIRSLREAGAAEVWPGAWKADGVSISHS